MGKIRYIFQAVGSGFYRFPALSIMNSFLFLYLIGRILFYGRLWVAYSGNDTMENLLLSVVPLLSVAASWQLFCEKRGHARPAWQMAVLILPGLLYLLFHFLSLNDYKLMYASGVGALGVLSFLWLLWRKGKESILFERLFASLLKAFVLGGIVFLLGMACFGSIRALLYPLSWDWVAIIFYGAFCLMGVSVFLSEICTSGEGGDLSFLVVSRLFLPAFSILLTVLYVYMGKILVLGKMPVGEMNWYASLAELAFAFIYVCLYGRWKDRKRYILPGLALAVIPVLVCQVIGVCIRLSAYGLTTLRCLSLGWILFMTFFIGMSVLGKCSRWMILWAGIIVLVLTISPWNSIDYPAYNQYQRTEHVLEKKGWLKDGHIVKGMPLDDGEKEMVQSTWLYLSRSQARFRYPLLEEFPDEWIRSQEVRRVYRTYEWKVLPAEGKVYIFGQTEMKKGVLSVSLDGEVQSFDLSDWLLSHGDEKQGTEENMTVSVPEGVLCFRTCDFPSGSSGSGRLSGYFIRVAQEGYRYGGTWK